MSLYNYIGNFPAQSSTTGNRGILSMPEHYDLKAKNNIDTNNINKIIIFLCVIKIVSITIFYKT